MIVDFWSDRKKTSFLYLTGHSVDCGFSLSSIILHFGPYHKRHFAENISNEIEQCLRHLNINEKITTITRDGESNMQSAFASFNPAIRVPVVLCARNASRHLRWVGFIEEISEDI